MGRKLTQWKNKVFRAFYFIKYRLKVIREIKKLLYTVSSLTNGRQTE